MPTAFSASRYNKVIICDNISTPNNELCIYNIGFIFNIQNIDINWWSGYWKHPFDLSNLLLACNCRSSPPVHQSAMTGQVLVHFKCCPKTRIRNKGVGYTIEGHRKFTFDWPPGYTSSWQPQRSQSQDRRPWFSLLESLWRRRDTFTRSQQSGIRNITK